jgi:hypothetical protein
MTILFGAAVIEFPPCQEIAFTVVEITAECQSTRLRYPATAYRLL